MQQPIAPSARPDQVNHRARLRDRFMQGGAAALPDYELLELVLFRAIPRRDVKPLAKALIAHFGGFNAVISASAHQLTEFQGVGAAIVQELKIVEAAAHRLAQTRVEARDVLSNWDALLDYCRTVMAHRETEQFHILFLDSRNGLLGDEAQQRGTVDHVPVYPREIARRALELSATAIILVHNHPSGDPTPSQADITMTKNIIAALTPLSIRVHDHLIIGKGSELSFRAKGLI
ncbi:DNA repair protein RadC [Monaibacterium marinum]|uniref:DNA repair protein RadC n=1 Tax=Pontivivens marinum TaxID=1690039 RepID=A0A2C9CNK3_9RHOB|nr:DNA repair protein RadC [Monaibacterium marinum]SOH92788.1 DNA repair protein RadC [Monaibacterium marinum]